MAARGMRVTRRYLMVRTNESRRRTEIMASSSEAMSLRSWSCSRTQMAWCETLLRVPSLSSSRKLCLHPALMQMKARSLTFC